jgi:hypothetical protein
MHLGKGYDLWARIVDKTLTTNKLDNFLTVADEAKKCSLLIHKYFLSSWDQVPSTQLASNNGPYSVEPSPMFHLMTIHKLLIPSRISS